MSLHTGWSASKSEPYIRTRLAHLSKSEIFFGNQGTSYISKKREKEKTRLLYTVNQVLGIGGTLSAAVNLVFAYLPRVDRSYLEAPYPPRSHASEAAG